MAFIAPPAVSLRPDSDTRNVVQPTAAATKALVLKGATSQSDTLLELLDSADAHLVSMFADAAATANRAQVNIGSNFGGGGAPAYSGDADGGLLGLNAPTSFAGDLFRAQVAGVNRFAVTNDTAGIARIAGPAANVLLRIDQAMSPSVNTVEVRSSSGTNLFAIGSTGLLTQRIEDTTNNAVSYVSQLAHSSSAAAGAANIGVGVQYRIETATEGTLETIATTEAVATTATAGATVGRLDLRVTDAGVLVTPISIATKKVSLEQVVLATANHGMLSVGSGGFLGGGGGNFAGMANGQLLALNAPSGFTGNLAEWQVNGVRMFSVDSSGGTEARGNLGVGGALIRCR
jgi:hypothetical protein